ncbi:MAG: ComEC family competence protein [Alphaproteobacteria bacterium]|nr:ComEC family competence protein [Alphaproteobacteria bacterium]
MYSLLERARDFYEREKFQIVHFIPVIFGCGICAYFYPDTEPSVIVSFILFTLSLIVSVLTRSKAAYTCLIFLSGFFIAQLRTISLNMPTPEKTPNDPISFYATIESCDKTEQGLNFIVKDIDSSLNLNKLFLTWKGEKALNNLTDYMPGDRVSVFAKLSPLHNQAFAKHYDFKKQQYFNGISARGFIFSSPRKVAHHFELDSIGLKIEKFRHYINSKIDAHLSKDSASVAKAIITGTKSGICKNLRESFTRSGTSHILAISGLHIGIIGFFVFWLMRIILNLIPIIAISCDVKKTAAVVSLIGVVAYYFISGRSVSALRALIMHSLIIIAILLNRRALTMRSVAIAAMCILLASPESIMFPSFQLSFSAVIAIVSFYEKNWNFSSSIGMIVNLIATTVVASVATSIFSIFVFNQLTLNSVFANIFAVPFMTFFIMPMAIIALLCEPFDISLPLHILAFGIEKLIALVEFSARLPGSLFIMPSPSDLTMLIWIISGLIFTLFRSRIRVIGIIGVIIGCLCYFCEERPRIVISPYAKVVGVKISNDLACFNHCGHFRGILSAWTKSVGCNKRENFNSVNCRKFIQKSSKGYFINLDRKQVLLQSFKEEIPNSIYMDEKTPFVREIYFPSLKEISNKNRKRPWHK